MTASIEYPSRGGQFIDRFLAFFAGAAIAVWFLGGLNSSSELPNLLTEPETRVVAELTSESTTVLTRLSEELILQVADSFQSGEETAPFATIGEDGQVRFLSVDSLGDPAESIQNCGKGSLNAAPKGPSVIASVQTQRGAAKVVSDAARSELYLRSTVRALTPGSASFIEPGNHPDPSARTRSAGTRAGPRHASNFVA